ncbi:MAG: hypothetical protein M3Y87_00555 [Myxococcota bacterium]|nr:hypothetical protein [Myxococcota bacterium]
MTERSHPARAARPRSRWVGCLALAIVAGTCLVCGGAALMRSPIATSIARARLLERGIECDDRFAVEVSWTLDDAIAAPTFCTVRSGAIESFELIDPLRVAIEDQQPSRIDGGGVRLTLREAALPADPEPGEWGSILEALAIPDRVGLLMGGLAQLATSDPPPMELSSLEVVRRGESVASLAGVHVDGATPLGVRVDRIALPALAGPLGAHAAASLVALESTSTPAEVEVTGELQLEGSLSILGALRHEERLRIVGTALDTPSPSYRVEL